MVVKETILKDWVFELFGKCRRSCLCEGVRERHERVIECCSGGGDCCECCRVVVVVDDEELNRLEGEEKGLLIHNERPAFASIFRAKSFLNVLIPPWKHPKHKVLRSRWTQICIRLGQYSRWTHPSERAFTMDSS